MIVTSKWYEHMCSWAQWLKTWCYQKCLSIAQHRKWLFYNGILSADFSANMFVNFFREKRLLAVDKYIGIVAGGAGPAQITAIAAYITFCPPQNGIASYAYVDKYTPTRQCCAKKHLMNG